MSLKSTKNALRKEIRTALKNMPLDERKTQSDAVIKKLLAHPKFNECQRVSIFISLPTEVQTETLIKKLLQMGKDCFVPRYREQTTLMEMVRIPSESVFDSLPLTKWNIKQPPFDVDWPEAVDFGGLDLVICPGVAFTEKGARMGHGMGYYDRYLNRLTQCCFRPYTIGVAFSNQIVPEVPLSDTDFILDEVLHP